MTREWTKAFLTTYLDAVEQCATGEALARFYAPDAQLIEHPNRLNPSGVTRDLAGILAAAEKGQALLARQTHAIESIVVDGDHAAVALRWSGVFKVDLPGVKAGQELYARVAQTYQLRDGRIWRQETFDCFET